MEIGLTLVKVTQGCPMLLKHGDWSVYIYFHKSLEQSVKEHFKKAVLVLRIMGLDKA